MLGMLTGLSDNDRPARCLNFVFLRSSSSSYRTLCVSEPVRLARHGLMHVLLANACRRPISALCFSDQQGTTNSAVAVIVDGQPIIIKNADGKFTTPSVVSYTSDNRKRNQRHVAGNGQNNREEDEQNADNLRSGVAAGGGVILGVGETPPGVFVGAAAVERLAIDPRSTYSSVKRVMGRTVKEAREAGVGLGALNVDQASLRRQLRYKLPLKPSLIVLIAFESPDFITEH